MKCLVYTGNLFHKIIIMVKLLFSMRKENKCFFGMKQLDIMINQFFDIDLYYLLNIVCPHTVCSGMHVLILPINFLYYRSSTVMPLLFHTIDHVL